MEHRSRFLITGATSGIGLAITLKALDEGHFVHAVGRKFDALKTLAGDRNFESRLRCIHFDICLNEIEYLTAKVEEIDHLVNAAGISKATPLRYYKESDMREVFEVNLIFPLQLCSYLLKERKIRKGGSITHISSISGNGVGILGNSIYSASKGGLDGAMASMALELARAGIRINSVRPGMVQTPLIDSVWVSSEELETDKTRYPLGQRYATPEEVADAALFLASERASFITGQSIVVDGGYTCQ